MNSNIPKIIWQTHEPEYSDLTENFKLSSMTWKNLNPGWEYRYVSAIKRAEQVELFDSELYRFYKHAAPVSQADLWRYVVIYQYGGFYADMDSVCATPLDYVLTQVPSNKQVVSTAPQKDGSVNNSNFGAVSETECFGDILDSIINMYQTTRMVPILDLVDLGMTYETAIKFQLATDPQLYSSVVLGKQEECWLNYTGALHSKDIKKLDWQPEYLVDYYGVSTPYLSLVKDNGWSLT